MTGPPVDFETWRYERWRQRKREDEERRRAEELAAAEASKPQPSPGAVPGPAGALARVTRAAKGLLEREPEEQPEPPREPEAPRPPRPAALGRDRDMRPGFYEEQEAAKGPILRFFEENTKRALTSNPLTNLFSQVDRVLQPGRGGETLQPSTAERLPEIGEEGPVPWYRKNLLPERLRRIDRASAVGGGTALDLLGGAANTLGMYRLGTTLRQAGQDIQQRHASRDTETTWQDVKRDRTNLEPFVIGALGKGLGTMAPVAVATAVNPALGFGAGWALGTGEVRNEMDQLGINQEYRDAVALGGGAVIGALDRIGASRAAGAIRQAVTSRFTRGTASAITHGAAKNKTATGFVTGIRNIFTEGAKGAATEALTEGAQEGVGYLASRVPFGVETDAGEMLARMEEGAAQGAVAGGGITAVTSVPGEVGRQRFQRQVQRAEEQARAEQEAAQALEAERQGALEEAAALQAARGERPEGPAAAGTGLQGTEVAPAPPQSPVQPPEASEGVQEAPGSVEDENRRLREEVYRSDLIEGMGNRRAFEAHRARIREEGREGEVEYFSADADQLKKINDTEGHQAGDEFLRSVGRALQQAAEELGEDPRTVAHLSGDEFAGIVAKGKGDAILARAREILGPRPIPGLDVQAGITGRAGPSFEEADRQLIEAKKARGAKYERGVTTEPLEVPGIGPVEGLGPSRGTFSLPTQTVLADPERFQFKQVTDKLAGVINTLRDVKTWDPDAAGVILVWKDPADGKVYVVNGHHRLDLAKRLGVERINVRFSDARTAEEARTQGALINIKEGRGSPVDVAKIMRDTGLTREDLDANGVSLREGLAEKGISLARLDDELFQSVTTGRLSEEAGVILGRELDTPALQQAALKVFRSAGRRISQAEMTEIARQVRVNETEKVTQDSLFGTEEEEVSLFLPKAQLAVALKRKLSHDRRLFGWVTKGERAEALEGVGDTKIDVDAAAEVARTSALLEELFGRLYEKAGPVGKAMTEAARRIANGERPADVAADIYDTIREGLLSEAPAPRGQGSGDRAAAAAPEGAAGEQPAATPQEVAPATGGGRDVATIRARGFSDAVTNEPYEATHSVGPITDFDDRLPLVGGAAMFGEDAGYAINVNATDVAGGTDRVVNLHRPLVIRTDADWSALTSAAGWPSATPDLDMETAAGRAEGRRLAEAMVAHLRAQGHDGVVVTPARTVNGLNDPETTAQITDLFDSGMVVELAAPSSLTADGRVRDSQDAAQDTLFLETMPGPVPPGIAEVMADPRSADGDQDSLFETGDTQLERLTNRTAADLLDLKARLKAETNPKRRARLAAQIAAAEALVNRDQKISAEEMAARAAAEREQDGPDDAADHRQGSLFSPANRFDDFGNRARKLLNMKPGRPRDQVKAIIQIAKQLETALIAQGHAPVFKGRLGRMGKMARGFFRTFGEGIWVRRADMIGTIAHEYGHSISKLILGWPTRRAEFERANWSRVAPPVGFPKEIRDELVKLGRALYGDRKPAGGYGEEGIAETFRLFVINPDHLRAEAPHVYGWLEQVFAKDPDFAAPWKAAQEEMQAYAESSLIEQVGAQISVNEKIRFIPRMRDLVRWVFDENHDLRLAVREISELKGETLTPRKNAFLLKRLLPGVDSMAQDWIEFGGFRRNSDKLKRVTRPIKRALELVRPERLQHFRYYLVGMSALDRYAHAITRVRRQEAAAAGRNPDFVPSATHADVLRLDPQARRWLETNYAVIMRGGLEGHVGITIDQAESVTPTEWAQEFADAAEIVWENERALIEYRMGVSLERDQANAILSAHPHHVAFAREFDPEELSVASRSDAGTAGTGVAFQKGSGRRIIDPIESILKNPFQTMRDVHSREILQMLAEQAMSTEGGDRIMSVVEQPKEAVRATLRNFSTDQLLEAFAKMGLQLPPEATANPFALREWLDKHRNVAFQLFLEVGHARALEQRDAVIPILMRDGSKMWFRLHDRQLYDLMARQPVLDSPGVKALKTMLRPAHAVTRALRIGATSTLEFGGVNIVRDLATAAMYSKARITLPGTNIWIAPAQVPVAIYRMMSGVSSLLKQDEWFQRFRIDRGDLASFQLQDRKEVQKRLQEFYKSSGPAARLYYVVRHPVDTLRVLTSVSEQANRIGEYKAVYAKAVARGESEQNARLKAGFAAREVTQDFAKMGTATREYNKLSAFFAAFIGGWSKFTEEALRPVDPEMESMQLNDEKGWERAQQFWTGAAVLLTLPSLLLYAAQKDDPAYRRIPRWKRAAFWSWVHRGNDQGPGWDGHGSGKVERIFLLPKPPLIGHLFGTIPELMAEMALQGNNNKAAEAALEVLVNQVNPLEMPVLFRPIVENAFDHSLFFDRPIEGPRLERLPMNERYDQRSSELAIALSNAPLLGGATRSIPGVREVIGSPKRLENLIRGYTGGIGGYALETGGRAVAGAREVAGLRPYQPEKAKDPRPLDTRLPGIRRFTQPAPGLDAETVQTFYQEYERKEQRFNEWERRRDAGQVAAAQAYLDRHRQDITDLATAERSGGTPGAWRRTMSEINRLRQDIRRYEAQDTEESRQRREAAITRIQQLAETRIGVRRPE